MRLVIQQFGLQNPTWAGNAWPGQNLTAQVTAPGLTADQRLEFVIQDSVTNERLDSIVAAAGQNSVQWPVLNLPSNPNVTFRAILREKPSPANAQLAAISNVASPAQALQSFGIQITNIDAAFVPQQEQLQVDFTITDVGNRATQGRYEVWGERYPGATPEPVYKAPFNPVGAVDWKIWNGQANTGYLNGKLITPEFSPYRVRIIIGTGAGDVDDPYGVGQGKVACAEAQFQIKFQTIGIRKWQNLQEATTNQEYELVNTLVVEPRNNDATGTYTTTAELPEERPLAAPAIAQVGRIRIPMARHQLIKDALDQGSLAVGGAYLEQGDDSKWKHDEPFYSRPELPVQFEPKLVSNNLAANPEGLFEAQAIGAVVIEPVAEQFYNAALYPPPAGVGTEHQNYWKNATFKVKRGKHNSPYHGSNNLPEFHYWQARFEVTGAQETSNDTGLELIDVSTFDNALKYRFGQKELFVYLDRRLLSRSDRTDNNEIDKYQFDYVEVDNGADSIQIRLRRKLLRVGQELWIVRRDSTASGGNKVKNWEQFPPGPNCHTYYGGVRGEEPTADLCNYFRAAFSKKGKKKPIIGKANAAFPFKKYIDMKPDLATQKKQERVQTSAMLDGNERGRAGIIFSPSVIGGDAYIIHAWIEREGYLRRFGFIEELPALRDKSGRLTVWRWSRIKNSFRLPDIGTAGLAANVGGEPEIAARVYHGDGANMEIQNGAIPTSTTYGDDKAFNEWSLTSPPSPVGGGGDPVHQHVVLADYRDAHNTVTGSWDGHVPLNNNGAIKNYVPVWDSYRWALPPGLPPNLPRLIANTINGLAVGMSTRDAGVAVHNAIVARGAGADDANLVAGWIAGFASADPDKYYNTMDGKWDAIMHAVLDKLTPRDASPEKVNVVRWPLLHERRAWKGYNAAGPNAIYAGTGGTLGFSRGDGQSMFATAKVDNALVRSPITNDNTFTHEMGHTMNLVHFRAGNFGWKHHDVNYPQCIMSYDYCGGIILQEGVANPVAAGGTQETGWPDAVPPAPLPDNYEGAVDADAGKACIHFPPIAEGNEACAKCLLKVRGWKDELLPFAWGHADLF